MRLISFPPKTRSTTEQTAFMNVQRSTSNAQLPRADMTYTRALKASDRFGENGSFLRMKNITMGYRFNNHIEGVETVNITFSVNNLFTITKYRWYDPDVNAFGSDPTRRGVDMDSYPSARTFNLGVQLSF